MIFFLFASIYEDVFVFLGFSFTLFPRINDIHKTRAEEEKSFTFYHSKRH